MVTRWSGPVIFCNSPIASISAILAFARAALCALCAVELRRLTLLKVSKPTAMTVSRIISDKVTTRAKPLSERSTAADLRGLGLREVMRWIYTLGCIDNVSR